MYILVLVDPDKNLRSILQPTLSLIKKKYIYLNFSAYKHRSNYKVTLCKENVYNKMFAN